MLWVWISVFNSLQSTYIMSLHIAKYNYVTYKYIKLCSFSLYQSPQILTHLTSFLRFYSWLKNSPTQWTWVWVSSWSWWWSEKAGVLQSTWLQRVGQDWAAELNWLLTVFTIISSQVALMVKSLLAKAGDVNKVGSIPTSGDFPEEGNGYPLQYSCLKNPMERSLVSYSP